MVSQWGGINVGRLSTCYFLRKSSIFNSNN